MRSRRITKPCFHTCSADGPRSQASFYLYARCPIADRAEDAFGLLRYFLGGDLPSQTAHFALSAARLHVSVVELKQATGGVSLAGSPRAGARGATPPMYATHNAPK